MYPTPPVLQGTSSRQLEDVRRYLFRLVEQLNSSADSLPGGVQAVYAPAASSGKVRTVGEKTKLNQVQEELKTLIIKTASVIQKSVDALQTRLESEYVAQSEFGTFRETMSNEITATAQGLEQSFRTYSEIMDNYITTTNGYIRQGVVGYEGLTPVIGIAIGQDIKVTGAKETVGGVEYETIDTTQNMSIWTADKLSFYVSGREVAYFANDALTVTNIHTGSITMGSWTVDASGGYSIRWTGENS